jgi:hypothetical protein
MSPSWRAEGWICGLNTDRTRTADIHLDTHDDTSRIPVTGTIISLYLLYGQSDVLMVRRQHEREADVGKQRARLARLEKTHRHSPSERQY